MASSQGKLLGEVKLPEGYMLVLSGYTLEYVTCGIFKAALHSVVSTAYHAHMKKLQEVANALWSSSHG